MEGEGADEISFAEEIDGIESLLHFGIFVERAVTCAVKRFASKLNLLGHREGYFSALEGKEFRLGLADEVSVRCNHTYIEVFDTGCASNIFRNRVIKLQFAYMAGDAGLAIAFIEHRDRARSDLQHRSARNGLGELGVCLSQLFIMLTDLLVLLADLDILLCEARVGGIKRINLADIIAHDSPHGRQFFLQFRNPTGVGSLCRAQFFEKILHALLLTAQKILQTVVADVHLLIAVELKREIFVFLLQFFFLDGHLLHHFVEFLSLGEVPDKKADDGSH